MDEKAKFRRVQLTEVAWRLVAQEAYILGTTESKYVNRLIEEAFSAGRHPIPKGRILV